MDSRSKQAVDEFAARVREQLPDAHIWAYGSRVRGDATPESDLDVCVVVDGLDEATDDRILKIAWQVSLKHEVVISTVAYSAQEFERGPISVSPFVRTVLAEGIPV